MIFGRPTNLWLGLITVAVSALTGGLLLAGVDPTVVAFVGTTVTSVLGAVIAIVAYQPPTVVQGSNITVSTPQGEPNVVATVFSPTQITPAGPA